MLTLAVFVQNVLCQLYLLLDFFKRSKLYADAVLVHKTDVVHGGNVYLGNVARTEMLVQNRREL